MIDLVFCSSPIHDHYIHYPGSMNWMAPEVLERPYDERSDVWSAGCIALEMATCGFYDHAQMSSRLFEIKKSPPALEETLEEVKKVCGVGRVGNVTVTNSL